MIQRGSQLSVYTEGKKNKKGNVLILVAGGKINKSCECYLSATCWFQSQKASGKKTAFNIFV